jgi:hypothetical protein
MNAIATQAVVELVKDITIVNDINAKIRPGMFVTAQLGNSGDVSWSPCATMLVLHTNATFFEELQFTGLYQRAPGEYYVARYVSETPAHMRLHATADMPIGIMYCTSAVPVDLATRYSEYLGAAENELLRQALSIHREKVAALPVVQRYKGDTLIEA